jgi:GT2 family glycosyltransferase/glycosyltransferase involved in cell wall biosynthesis
MRSKSLNEEVGFLDSFEGRNIRGWAKSADSQACLVVMQDNRLLKSFNATKHREDLFISGYGDCAFDEPLSEFLVEAYKEKREVVLGVKFKRSLRHLNGSPIRINARDTEYQAILDHNVITGWIKDLNNPTLKFKVSLTVNNQVYKEIVANQSSVGMGNGYSFKFDLERFSLSENSQIELSAEVIGNVFPVPIKNIGSREKIVVNGSEVQYVSEVKGGTINLFPSEIERTETDLQRTLIYPDLHSSNALGDVKPLVVIPIYDGVEETILCINSVFNVKNNESFNVLVIDDFGPNDRIRQEVEELKARFGFEYIKNKENLGFVKTANLGLSLSAGADVILLNSDTVVTDYWLDNLKQACYQEDNIGTVTPMSNNASICSFPQSLIYNDFPSNKADIPSVGTLFNENPDTVFDIPTAHGFCMYIRFDAMKDVGLFDEEMWGVGYGEENDLSMRMSYSGWRNVMVANTFVYHHGSVSFSERAGGLMENSLQKLVRIYPEYLKMVEMHNNLDPARETRNEVSKKIIQASLKPHSVLIVRHNFFGGTDKAIEESISKLIELGSGCFTLKVDGDDYWVVTDENSGGQLKLSWRTEMAKIVDFLQLLNIEIIDYHNVLQFSPCVKNLPSLIGAKYLLSVHDYYLICPQLTLTDKKGRFCNEPDVSACNNCIKENGVYDSLYMEPISFNSDIKEWRADNARWVDGAEKIIVPDIDVKNRLLKYFVPSEVEVLPHDMVYTDSKFQNLSRSSKKKFSKRAEIVIGVVGAIGYHKGLSNLYKLVQHIESKRLNASVKVIGYTEQDSLFGDMKRIKITGRYQSEELEIHLRNVDVVLFPGEVPETYSYVLSEVLSHRKKIVAMDVGAIASRLRELNVGRIISLPFSEAAVFKEIYEYVNDSGDCAMDALVVESKSKSYLSLKKLYNI